MTHDESGAHLTVSEREAKAGIELHRMRWVLGISIALAVVALAIWWLVAS